jgi:hypothetical protein
VCPFFSISVFFSIASPRMRAWQVGQIDWRAGFPQTMQGLCTGWFFFTRAIETLLAGAQLQ